MFLAIFVLAIITSMPIVAIVLVSVASKREDAAGTLGGPAKGVIQFAARRVLDYRSDITWHPATDARIRADRPVTTPTEQLQEEDDSPILLASALALTPAA
ncbi:MAG TPA: hypothetical protein VN767_20730 [Streptosporangiaceae bacterium]|jgi:hypothetical protein|nr:hypothetical protein [Streptosporangiaceae bacterium]